MRALRCRACPSSSRMTAAAPSPITQPFRRRSKGLDAAGPSSLLALTASRAQKAASSAGLSIESEPPAIMTSASSRAITQAASPTACAPAEHRLTLVSVGPRAW